MFRNRKYMVGAILLTYSFMLGQNNLGLNSTSPNSQDEVGLSINLRSSQPNKLEYAVVLRNESSKIIYYSANPQDACGNYGPYISMDRDDTSIVNIQSRVFDRDIVMNLDCYSNKTGVELKKLNPGEIGLQIVLVKWPLSETAPPNLRKGFKKIERGGFDKLRFTVGYFEEEAGLLKFLVQKPFGWFTKGTDKLEVGAFRGKRLYEVQKSASSEVTIPESSNR